MRRVQGGKKQGPWIVENDGATNLYNEVKVRIVMFVWGHWMLPCPSPTP